MYHHAAQNTFADIIQNNTEDLKIMKTEAEILSKETELNIAIGYEVAQMLNLKFDKQGRCKTTWGSETVLGLGACINRIIEEQKERLNK